MTMALTPLRQRPPSNVFRRGQMIPAGYAPPVNTAAPSLSGATTVGSTLTIVAGTWAGSPAPALTYQIQVDGVDVADETGPTFDTTGLAAGDVVTVIETASSRKVAPTATSAGVTLT